MTSASRVVLDEIQAWVDVMRHYDLSNSPPRRGHVADLVVAALSSYSEAFVDSRASVGEPIDRVAALWWSAGTRRFADWDAEKASDVGKQELRGDAVALLAGLGVGVLRGLVGDALISTAIDEYRGHIERQGDSADDRTLAMVQQWARASVDYLTDPASGCAAASRPHILGWNE